MNECFINGWDGWTDKGALTRRVFDNNMNVLLGRLVGKVISNILHWLHHHDTIGVIIFKDKLLNGGNFIFGNVDLLEGELVNVNVTEIVLLLLDFILEVGSSVSWWYFDRES